MAHSLAEKTDGFTGAQIVNIIDSAAMTAAYQKRNRVSEQDYIKAIAALGSEIKDAA